MVLDHLDGIHVVEGTIVLALILHEYTCFSSREVLQILHGAVLHVHVRSRDIGEFLQCR